MYKLIKNYQGNNSIMVAFNVKDISIIANIVRRIKALF